MNNKTNNIDDEEIHKFNHLSNVWWDKNGKLKILHQINPLRLNYIKKHSNGIFSKKILDIGCGGGIFTESMTKEGAQVTGIEIGQKLLEIAQSHALKNKLNINYIQETIEEHSKNKLNYYDIITCMEVLEHVPNPMLIVQSCAKLVKPYGDVYLSTLNRTFKSWLYAIIGAEYILNLLPRGMHKIQKCIQPAELLDWIDNTELKEQHISGISYSILFNQFYLSKDIDINYIMHTKKI